MFQLYDIKALQQKLSTAQNQAKQLQNDLEQSNHDVSSQRSLRNNLKNVTLVIAELEKQIRTQKKRETHANNRHFARGNAHKHDL
ncbi:hypothetical protein [Leuconostoc falkenbergense]|uniref:hypothetical protein n=1 Tax=Leuconostoc falkenbergense TaxID=2766470 RepID=UPI0019679BA9|nr:hypothetical protein [Leuconostoc falkenbergense]MDI6553651.1 hypothetical protein [Leuconostoc falkenbergense]MDI6667920.1 hypothetical protein [Leuconostoc falkenbergense]QSB51698.1 hypothetical protein I6J31_01270 [Leuconostoc falkenbergense]